MALMFNNLRSPDDVDCVPSARRHSQLPRLFDEELSGLVQSTGNWQIARG